jgi:hypothetical protein
MRLFFWEGSSLLLRSVCALQKFSSFYRGAAACPKPVDFQLLLLACNEKQGGGYREASRALNVCV